jgi:hypothetical protein
MGTTNLSLLIVIASIVIPQLFAFGIHLRRNGWHQLQGAVRKLTLAVAVTATGWTLVFGYHFLWALPQTINGSAQERPISSHVKGPGPPKFSYMRSEEAAHLGVSFVLREGFSFTANSAPTSVAISDAVRQYLFSVRNEAHDTLSSVDLLVQLPYAVQSSEISSIDRAIAPVFEPSGRIELHGSPGAGGEIVRQMITENYHLRIAELLPSGEVQVSCILNSDRTGYFEPQSSPYETYIYGHFIYHLGPGVIGGPKSVKGEYYAPFHIAEGKITVLGRPRLAPVEKLVESVSFH